ncbi:2316_t:CDS:2 [Dentiscutata erythropus]|uniref:2316_t:CDS:1 n=1 Tax=Dentiscutata erythropus TaxID=1348616 RepID=A0A9N9IXS6_9GLOM|nr:2316_t:CDS:2 [Dentiscutata erythropus]
MLQGEPSICRSSHPIKCINYTKTDESNEKRELRKVRRTNNITNSESAKSSVPRTPLQVPRVLTLLKTMSNKRPISNEEILQYSEDISVICTFDKSVDKLTLEISAELANKLSSVYDTNPKI